MKTKYCIKYFLTILLLLFCGCKTYKDVNSFEKSTLVLNKIIDSSFQIYTSKKLISRDLVHALKFYYPKNSKLAEKDGIFNFTDVPVKNIPYRRFVFGGNTLSKNLSFVVFEEGGVILKNYCLIVENQNNVKKLLQEIYLFEKPLNIGELIQLVKDRKFDKLDDDY